MVGGEGVATPTAGECKEIVLGKKEVINFKLIESNS